MVRQSAETRGAELRLAISGSPAYKSGERNTGEQVDQPTIPFSISWLARLMRTRFDARARTLGLTRAQWSMIGLIRVMEGATQSDLAAKLEINSVTAGRIIDKLEAAGWIERRADPTDRRANRLYLRESAGPMIDKLDVLAVDEQNVAVQGISAEEQAAMKDVLARMIHNLNTIPVPPSALIDDETLLTSSVDCE
jgi:MarR family transcriptional regulator for hemolysin